MSFSRLKNSAFQLIDSMQRGEVSKQVSNFVCIAQKIKAVIVRCDS